MVELEDDEPPQPQPLDEDSRNTRIMAGLKDSLLSQLTELDPTLSPSTRHSSYLQRRLQQLFRSFDTPTHPPYALMISTAITELDDGNGSTEEAISEFVRREYEDLPWAHAKILGVHLRKLCEAGELACTESGRYALPVDGGGEETERCKGSRKRKRGKRRSNRGDGDRKGTLAIEIERCNGLQEDGIHDVSRLDSAGTNEPMVESTQESEKGRLEVVGEQSQHVQHVQEEAMAPNELQEDSIPHLETTCSPQLTALNPVDSQHSLPVPISEGLSNCIPAAGMGLTQTQLQLQVSCHGPSESRLDAAAEMLASLSSLNVEKHKQDENPISGLLELKRQRQPNHQCRKRPRKSKPVEDHQEESLFSSCDAILTERKRKVKKTDKCWRSQPQGRGLGREMHSKLLRKARRNNEHTQPQDQADQAQALVNSPHSVQNETINSSQPTVPKFPFSLNQSFGQQSVAPTLEGSPECTISTGPGIELSPPIQLQPQISSDINLCVVSKMTPSLTSVNVHDDRQPQHCNQGNPKGNRDDKPMSGGIKQKPKRPRGRPPKSVTFANDQGESLLPSHDNPNEQKPKGPRGRPRKSETVNPMFGGIEKKPKCPRGRPPKSETVDNYQRKSLLPLDDGIHNKQRPNINNTEKQHGAGRGRGRGRGRPRKQNRNTEKCGEQLQQKDQAKRSGRGRPRKVNCNKNQQLHPQDQSQGVVRSSNSGVDDTRAEPLAAEATSM